MSDVNIQGVINNINARTNAYTPLIEVIVNSIQSLEETKKRNKKITIQVLRSNQQDLITGIASVVGFKVIDNGIGFNDENRGSFNTLYSEYKAKKGGKGFGRFVSLKYFDHLKVESVYQNNTQFFLRTFKLGSEKEIIVNEEKNEVHNKVTGSTVILEGYKKGEFPEKTIERIAQTIVERILPYFLTENYDCPIVVIEEEDTTGKIILNDYLNNSNISKIEEVNSKNFHIDNEKFFLRLFKFFSPKSQRSHISLVADKREVTATALHKYVSEFEDEFYEISDDGSRGKNYIIKAYIFGQYLDASVSIERGEFNFSKTDDELNFGYSISQDRIECHASEIVQEFFQDEYTKRSEKKKKTVSEYINNNAPWLKHLLQKVNLSPLPYKPEPYQIEEFFYKQRFKEHQQLKKDVESVLGEKNYKDFNKKASQISEKVSDSSRCELAHYIALRKSILSVFEKSLEINEDGKYASEGSVHDIIFPRRSDDSTLPFEYHNLWIIDERLNFTEYVSSDNSLDKSGKDRPDLLAFGNRIMFREGNQASCPVSVFEFKRPQRDDFVNPSSSEDPIEQVIRYVNNIRRGKYTTPKGKNIIVQDTTPYYGYVVCDLTPKVNSWLKEEKDFTVMPDAQGWFKWQKNINLYIEVLSWDKLLNDAQIRNKLFFEKLGI